jgi:hypothetical protein
MTMPALFALLSSVVPQQPVTPALSPAEARAIAKEAYVYGFPLVDSYRIQHAYFVDPGNPEHRGPWNQLFNTGRVFTPEDTAVQTPNSDTPYSMAGLDLRTEPLVLTLPAIEEGRYFSVQFIDAYTHNFDYLGSRTSGNGGGSFLIAGPNWSGETPAGIQRVLRAETELALLIVRTQLFRPDDIEAVRTIQAGYRLATLSAHLARPAPTPAPALQFPRPLTPETTKTSLEFFELLDFVLGLCPVHPSERELRDRFARAGIGAEGNLEVDAWSEETKKAFAQGMAEAWQVLAERSQAFAAGQVTSAEAFGSREHLANNYANRFLGAVVGIYANSAAEAIYPSYRVDTAGQPLDGSKGRYTLRFPPGQLPPANAFWSATLYKLPESLLYANDLGRYLINAPMLPDLVRDADGGLTLHIQHDSPGKDRERNWLPAPNGPFWIALRLYWPKPEVLNGTWKQPPLERAAR